MPLLQTSAVLLLEVIEDFMGQWLKGGVDVVLPNAVLSFDNPVQFIYISTLLRTHRHWGKVEDTHVDTPPDFAEIAQKGVPHKHLI